MTRARYVIDCRGDRWFVRLDDVDFGPYADKNAAVRAAISAANKASARGLETEVVMEGTDREIRTPWTFALDADSRTG